MLIERFPTGAGFYGFAPPALLITAVPARPGRTRTGTADEVMRE